MWNGRVMIIRLMAGQIKKISLKWVKSNKMSYFPEWYSHIKSKIKIEWALPNYSTKSDLKGGTSTHTSKYAKKWFR